MPSASSATPTRTAPRPRPGRASWTTRRSLAGWRSSRAWPTSWWPSGPRTGGGRPSGARSRRDDHGPIRGPARPWRPGPRGSGRVGRSGPDRRRDLARAGRRGRLGGKIVVVASVGEDAYELAGQILARLQAGGHTVAVAESLTGGLVAAALTDIPGASASFRGGVVTYATELKASLLGVDPGMLARHGAVHPHVATSMAEGVRSRLGASFGLATTGVAGPEPPDGQPGGTG